MHNDDGNGSRVDRNGCSDRDESLGYNTIDAEESNMKDVDVSDVNDMEVDKSKGFG